MRKASGLVVMLVPYTAWNWWPVWTRDIRALHASVIVAGGLAAVGFCSLGYRSETWLSWVRIESRLEYWTDILAHPERP